MNGLIDIHLVLTQILGFVLFVAILSRFAWKPILAGLEQRRAMIQGQFDEAARRQAEAAQLKDKYDSEMRTIEATARQKMQDAIVEGQRIAGELKAQAQADKLLATLRASGPVKVAAE